MRKFPTGHTIAMNKIRRISSIGLPAVIGLGLVWVGTRIMSNEKKLKTREIELQLQLDAKSIEGI